MRARADGSLRQRSRRRLEERQEDVEKNKKKKNKTDEEPRKNNGKDHGRKKVRIWKQAERRSRSKEDRVERDAKKSCCSKADSMSAESISDSELYIAV